MVIFLRVAIPLALGDSPKKDDHKRWVMTTQRHYTHINRFLNIRHQKFFRTDEKGAKDPKERRILGRKLARFLT